MKNETVQPGTHNATKEINVEDKRSENAMANISNAANSPDSDIGFEPRTVCEISDALDQLFDKIWFHRHLEAGIEVERGEVRIEKRAPGEPPDETTIDPEIWNRALHNASSIEQKFTEPGELGPWTDFELEILHGKLAALRWALGDEWDDYDTQFFVCHQHPHPRLEHR